MMSFRSSRLRSLSGAAALAVILATAGARLATAQSAQSVKFGSVRGSAVRARIELSARRITLTGDVDVQTNDGDRLQADKVVLLLNANRTEVQTAEATGNVTLAMRRRVAPRTGTPYIQMINANANRAVFNNQTRNATLTGDVNGKADDPFMLTTFRAATVNIDLTPASEVIEAEGSPSQKAQVNYQSKAAPKPAAPAKG